MLINLNNACKKIDIKIFFFKKDILFKRGFVQKNLVNKILNEVNLAKGVKNITIKEIILEESKNYIIKELV